MLKIEGVYPALITPFTKDDEVDKEGLRRLVEYMIEGGVAGIVPCGTTGESATLSHKEHEEVIDVVVDCSKVPVIAGTGSNNTKEAVEFTKHAADAGADACLLITPYYNKPNVKGLKEHFKRIGDSVEIPLILYNIPSRTAQNVNAGTMVELASEITNIKGVKEASGDLKQVGAIIRSVAEQGLDFTVVAGDDFLTLPIMSLGGKGVISVAANIAPREMTEMVDAMLKGKVEKAKEINIRLFSLFEAMFLETNPIPVKKAAEMMGLVETGDVRLPLGALSEGNEEKLRAVLKGLGMV
uniref:4-hydroxy-tetrahydrodipicolinate synthase n=1 Tax=Candidatus Methanophagaceae archaeon ANME-1 ERB6 TaxID=2759912 RepID=A0A7G9YYT0_9EURY|nr:dihydrodipicolinate synthase/N-acetylneuraminate lyase [uncultured archaeon GZfos26D8]QNO53164.1 4-hydroxy-tetrahydrodipicolinate synthase [Methanosarcinales archaeon ANME-1 ERB6]